MNFILFILRKNIRWFPDYLKYALSNFFKSYVQNEYQIDELCRKRVAQIKDLGILFDQKLCFINHIEFIISASSDMLGFMFRICKDFDDLLLMKIFYFAYVRSHLEYGSIAWYPNYEVYIERIESVQRRFLNYIFRNFGYLHYIKFASYFFKLDL